MIELRLKCKPIGFFEVAHGTCDACISGIREIFIRTLLSGASGIVLVHNRSSGEPDPSHADVSLKKRIEEAAGLMGIALNDHIIIGKDTYFSFREHQYIRQDEDRGAWAG